MSLKRRVERLERRSGLPPPSGYISGWDILAGFPMPDDLGKIDPRHQPLVELLTRPRSETADTIEAQIAAAGAAEGTPP